MNGTLLHVSGAVIDLLVGEPCLPLLPETLEESADWMIRREVQRSLVLPLQHLLLLTFHITDLPEDDL